MANFVEKIIRHGGQIDKRNPCGDGIIAVKQPAGAAEKCPATDLGKG